MMTLRRAAGSLAPQSCAAVSAISAPMISVAVASAPRHRFRSCFMRPLPERWLNSMPDRAAARFRVPASAISHTVTLWLLQEQALAYARQPVRHGGRHNVSIPQARFDAGNRARTGPGRVGRRDGTGAVAGRMHRAAARARGLRAGAAAGALSAGRAPAAGLRFTTTGVQPAAARLRFTAAIRAG